MLAQSCVILEVGLAASCDRMTSSLIRGVVSSSSIQALSAVTSLESTRLVSYQTHKNRKRYGLTTVSIPRFDAHIEVYSKHKQVTVQYDSPYVKGLPVTMTIKENVNGSYSERLVRKTYEDPYTLVSQMSSGAKFQGSL